MTSKFSFWAQRLQNNQVKIHSCKELGRIHREGDPSSYLEVYDVGIETPDGHRLTRAIALRGDSVQVVPVLLEEETRRFYTILVEQRRIVDGGLTFEFVGGMIDEEDDCPRSVCAREVEEEMGMVVPFEAFKPLRNVPMPLCTSLLDENIHYYYFVQKMKRQEIHSYQKRLTGLREKGEFITTRVFPIKEVESLDRLSAGSLLGLFLVLKELES